ncbi:MAG TPA: hypothetical protein VF954_01190 [Acidimicrobiales bacterium]
MSVAGRVTLQVNLAPADLPHARLLLGHQLRQLGGQVDEILLVVDRERGAGRFADGWDEGRPLLDELLATAARGDARIRVQAVDYGADAAAAISRRFLRGRPAPRKDFRGGPFYSYLYGLHACATDLVLHIDSDMLFGGGSQTWVRDATAVLEGDARVVAASPLPGPPSPSGRLLSQRAERYPEAGKDAYRFDKLSTRVFLASISRLERTILPIGSTAAAPRRRLEARLRGSEGAGLPEDLLSRAMCRGGFRRVDLLGPGPGLWSLHPRYRPPAFYAALPELIERVERGDVPDGQRGRHDIAPCLVPLPARRDRGRIHQLSELARACRAPRPVPRGPR